MDREQHLLMERRALLRRLGIGGGLHGLMGGGVAGSSTAISAGSPAALADASYEAISASDITSDLVSAAKNQLWDPFWESLRGSWSAAISELKTVLRDIADEAFDIVSSPFDDGDNDSFSDTLEFSMSGIETLLDKADLLISHGERLASALGKKANSLEKEANSDDEEESDSQSIRGPPSIGSAAGTGSGIADGATVGTSSVSVRIGSEIKEKYDQVSEYADDAVDSVTDVVSGLGIKSELEGLWGDVEGFVDAVASISDYIEYAAEAVFEVLLQPLKSIKGDLEDAFSNPTSVSDYELDMSVFGDNVDLAPRVTSAVDSVAPRSDTLESANAGSVGARSASSAGRTGLGYSPAAANDNSHIEETLEEENIILTETLEDFLEAADDSSVYEVLRENEELDEFFEDIEDEYIEDDIGRDVDNYHTKRAAFRQWMDDNNIENKADLRDALAEYDVVFKEDLKAFFDGASFDTQLQFKDCKRAPSDEVYAMQTEMKLSDNASVSVFVGHDPFDPACFYVATDGSLKIEVDGQQIGAWVLEYQQHWKDIGNCLETYVENIDGFDGEEITGVETVADLEDLSDSLETFETDLEQWLDRREISTETAYDLINEFFEEIDIENDLGDLADELETQHDNLADQIESATEEIEADIGAIEDEFASHLRDFSSALELDELRDDLGETEIKVEDGELLPPDEAIGVVADWAGELGEQQTEDLNVELPRQTQQTSTELINWIDGLGKSDKEAIKSQTGVDLDTVKTYLEYFDEGTFDASQMANDLISNRVEKILTDIKSRAEDMMTWSHDFGNDVLDSGCTRRCPEKPKPTPQPVLERLIDGAKDTAEDAVETWDGLPKWAQFALVVLTVIIIIALAKLVIGTVVGAFIVKAFASAAAVPVIICIAAIAVIGSFIFDRIDHQPL